MNRKVIWMVPLLAVSSSIAMADITLDFVKSDAARGFSENGGTITLDFTIDGSGGVSLIAAPVGTGDASYLDAVNSWTSGDVGTVTEASLFGSSFQLTIRASDADDPTVRLSLDGRYGDGIMGVGGGNSSRVDFTSGPQEFLHFEQTGGTAQIKLLDFGYHGASTSTGLWDTQLIAGGVDNTFYDLPGSEGTFDVSSLGYVIGSGANELTFSEPLDGSHGIGVAGLTLQAVPEPATFGLWAVVGAALLLLRRRFMS